MFFAAKWSFLVQLDKGGWCRQGEPVMTTWLVPTGFCLQLATMIATIHWAAMLWENSDFSYPSIARGSKFVVPKEFLPNHDQEFNVWA